MTPPRSKSKPAEERAIEEPWKRIFERHGGHRHDFDEGPLYIDAEDIKRYCQDFTGTSEKEVRILCKQDTREKRPSVFRERNLFILPVRKYKLPQPRKWGYEFAIIKGEGYVDIPEIKSAGEVYRSDFPFELETSREGDSESQHLDYSYAMSLVRHFVGDDSIVLTIRGRKFVTTEFECVAGDGRHRLNVKGITTEVDAGYEGREQVVLIEAKGQGASNTIIRQLYYPFRKWSSVTNKKIFPLFFERRGDLYCLWQFEFTDPRDYNSIRLVRSGAFRIARGNNGGV